MTEETAAKIRAERQRQTEKWGGGQFREMRPERVLAVLLEEVGEVANAILEFNRHQNTGLIEAEIVQVAAVAARWLDECFSEPGETGQE